MSNIRKKTFPVCLFLKLFINDFFNLKIQGKSENGGSTKDSFDFSAAAAAIPSSSSSPASAHAQNDEDLDRQEREIIAGLEMEEREHRKYIERKGKKRENSYFKSFF